MFREKILIASEAENGFEGELELAESYFGGKHHKGKRGKGSENKIPVFGILFCASTKKIIVLRKPDICSKLKFWQN
ncbi:MAG: hypothetical protein ACI37T_03840 [Candidatus Gastranaerophilaceae bacterium]